MPRMLQLYREKSVPELLKLFGYHSIMQVPRVMKTTVNVGLGRAVSDKKLLDGAMRDLALITGQRPVLTRARKSVSNFKVRMGWPVGCKVTLRGPRMYEFLDRLVSVTLPRIRDFRGLSGNAFDGRGNYSLGIREHFVFPEIDYDSSVAPFGMDICVTTSVTASVTADDEAKALLTSLNFPLRGTGRRE